MGTNMTDTIRRSAVLLFSAAALAVLATTPAWASETLESHGVVTNRDLGASTLRIENRVFHVTSQTTFSDARGNLLSFESMPVFDVHRGLFSFEDATKVEYRATRSRDGEWELTSVQIVTALPD